MSTVEIRGVSKSFGKTAAVKELSFEVREGEFVSLLGPSGCGKTTLLRLLAGFLKPDRGSILIAGRDVAQLPPYRRNVGFVFQSYALFPHLNVRDNVAFGLKMRGIDDQPVQSFLKHYIELVRLTGFEDRYPSELSGGQQQRVALARALIIKPDVLLLDEPLSALDRKLRQEMQGELRSLQRAVGITTLVVTHDQEEALTMSDRIAVMSGGRIEQIGTPTEIYEQPRNRFVSDFIGQSNFFEGEIVNDRQNGVRFRTMKGMELDIPTPEDLSTTTQRNMVVRPEKVEIHLDQPDVPHSNVFVSEVKQVVYQGNCTQVLTEVNGVQITVSVQNFARTTANPYRVGQKVYVCIDPQSLCLLSS